MLREDGLGGFQGVVDLVLATLHVGDVGGGGDSREAVGCVGCCVVAEEVGGKRIRSERIGRKKICRERISCERVVGEKVCR